MTQQTDAELAPIVAASAEGKVIECMFCTAENWSPKNHPGWHQNYAYRIAPEQPKPKVKMLVWRDKCTGRLVAFEDRVSNWDLSICERVPHLDYEVGV